jgi:hypothetical protein
MHADIGPLYLIVNEMLEYTNIFFSDVNEMRCMFNFINIGVSKSNKSSNIFSKYTYKNMSIATEEREKRNVWVRGYFKLSSSLIHSFFFFFSFPKQVFRSSTCDESIYSLFKILLTIGFALRLILQ